MKRRAFIGTLAAAAMAPAAAAMTAVRDDWITVAHPGENLNHHVYSEKALEQMREGLIAKRVLCRLPYDALLDGRLEDIVGLVKATRRSDEGCVQVRVSWQAAASTSALYLTPNGNAKAGEWKMESDGRIVIDGYEPMSLLLAGDSAFERATQL